MTRAPSGPVGEAEDTTRSDRATRRRPSHATLDGPSASAPRTRSARGTPQFTAAAAGIDLNVRRSSRRFRRRRRRALAAGERAGQLARVNAGVSERDRTGRPWPPRLGVRTRRSAGSRRPRGRHGRARGGGGAGRREAEHELRVVDRTLAWSARSRLIRSTIGGWVEKRSDCLLELLDRVGEVQVLGRAVGDLEDLLVDRDLGQRLLEAHGVARQLDGRGVGEVLALAADRQLDEAGDDRGEDGAGRSRSRRRRSAAPRRRCPVAARAAAARRPRT